MNPAFRELIPKNSHSELSPEPGRGDEASDWRIKVSETEMNKTGNEQETSVNWPTVAFLIIFHLASLAALWFWSWPAIITAAVLLWVAGSLGIGMGWHRLLTHRGYKIVFTTLIPMKKEIRIRRATDVGGHTSAGFWFLLLR